MRSAMGRRELGHALDADVPILHGIEMAPPDLGEALDAIPLLRAA